MYPGNPQHKGSSTELFRLRGFWVIVLRGVTERVRPIQRIKVVCNGGGALCRCHENLVKIAKKVKTAAVLADWACASEAKTKA